MQLVSFLRPHPLDLPGRRPQSVLSSKLQETLWKWSLTLDLGGNPIHPTPQRQGDHDTALSRKDFFKISDPNSHLQNILLSKWINVSYWLL